MMNPRNFPLPTFLLALTLTSLLTLTCTAQSANNTPGDTPHSQSDGYQAGQAAISGFKVPTGFNISLFAAEPFVVNPVAFCIDEKGALYIAETFRQSHGVEDNRSHEYWLLDDLAANHVNDRIAKYQKWTSKRPLSYFNEKEDRVKRIADTNNDSIADTSSLFAEGFNDILDGTGAGLLALNGDIFYTSIPSLWRLNDKDNDGIAEQRDSLHYGFGVRDALRGHDMHGLALGPDGRIYFSIGDRGYNIRTPEGRHLIDPLDTGRGAVFSCWPNGEDLKVVHYGLRNPQELAFDQHGNLFTVDNNSDAGDMARLVQIIQDADTGWDMAYQTMEGDYQRGPWNAEKLWHPQFKNQAAWVLPPIAWITSGPSGFTYNPGVGLRSQYDNHFFICDFRANTGNSGIWSFAVEPSGASFKMVNEHQFFWHVVATDVDFGYDGKMYIADWISGWEGVDGGRIYTLTDSQATDATTVAQTKSIFANGFKQRSVKELIALMTHPDMRVRNRAHFAIAALGSKSIPTFANLIHDSTHQLQRLHALWGLGIIARNDRASLNTVQTFLDDDDIQIRAHAAKILGDYQHKPANVILSQVLLDDSPRVRLYAALALAQLGGGDISHVTSMLRANDDQDPTLRHAGAMALTAQNPDTLANLTTNKSAAVRLAALLAMRRTGDKRIAAFLNDTEPHIVTEAARAINDQPITAATQDLAALIANYTQADSSPTVTTQESETNYPLLRRIINANLRMGGPLHAQALAQFIATPSNPQPMRIEAIAALADFANPSPRDRIMGVYRPLPPRDAAVLVEFTAPIIAQLLETTTGPILGHTFSLAQTLNLTIDNQVLFKSVADKTLPTEARILALQMLVDNKPPNTINAVDLALTSESDELQAAARTALLTVDPARAINELGAILNTKKIFPRQQALADLATLNNPQALRIINTYLDKLIAGGVAHSLNLDIIQAVETSAEPTMLTKLRDYQASLASTGDILAPYNYALHGGNIKRGKQIFETNAATQCMRCHRAGDRGGDAGPELAGLLDRAKGDRNFILESILNPNAAIAKGYGTTVLIMKDGSALAGAIRTENKKTLTLIDAELKARTIKVDKIQSRTPPVSGMPPMLGILKPKELRDLIAFLASVKPIEESH